MIETNFAGDRMLVTPRDLWLQMTAWQQGALLIARLRVGPRHRRWVEVVLTVENRIRARRR